MSEKLKPCPFCGKIPEVRRVNTCGAEFSMTGKRGEFGIDMELECSECGIKKRDSVVFIVNETCHPAVISDGYKRLVDWWNKRAGEANEST